MRQKLKTALILASLCPPLFLTGGGCDREKPIASYDAPKDVAQTASVDTDKTNLTFPDDLRWTLPSGWKQVPVTENPVFTPSAAIAVSADQPSLVLTVSKLPDAPEARSVYENVKRWSRQLALDVPPENGLDKIVAHVQLGSISANVITLAGASESATKLLGAIVPHEADTWVFKLSGSKAAVEPQVAAFNDFVRSIHFDGAGPQPAVAAAQAPSTPPQVAATAAPTSPPAGKWPSADKGVDGVTWSLPRGWMAQPGDGFRFATIHPAGNSAAIIKVSKLNNGGSAGANVSRWHGEVGLPPVDDKHADAGVQTTLGEQKWLFHDYTGPKDGGTREIIAQRDSGGSTWYFKLVGPTSEVTKLQDDFSAFIGSIHLPQ